MCIKAGDNELDSVMALMGMSLKAIVADSLDADLDDVIESARLVEDLHMDAKGKVSLEELVAEYFDGFQVDAATTPTFGDLLEKVVLNEFRDLEIHREDEEAA